MKKDLHIKLKDQINCMVDGLTPEDKSLIYEHFTIFVKSAIFTPSYKLGRWDGKIHYFHLNGLTYNTLLPELLSLINLNNYNVILEDVRMNNSEYKFDEIDENYFSDYYWDDSNRFSNQPIKLFDHQVTIVNKCLNNQKALVESATSSGKTAMIAALAKKVSEKGKFIIIVPAKDLAIQTKGTLEKVGLDVGIVGMGYREFDHKVIICTWQTINSMERRSKSRKVEEDDRLLTAEEKRKLVNGTIGILFDECLDENTLITMSDGSAKRIKDCTVGDKVIVYNEEIKEFVEDEVESVYVNLYPSKEEDMYEIEMEDNTTIKITGNHKVLTNRGWLMVKELTENDEIIDYK